MTESRRTLMVVGAHSLDAEVMGGPAIIKWTRTGGRAVIVHATRGERGHKSKSPQDYAVQLETEMHLAAEKMGAEVRWMGYEAGKIPGAGIAAEDMARLIRDICPEVVITHWRGSIHPRHLETHDMVLEGVRLAATRSGGDSQRRHIVSAVYFGENLEDLDGFTPNVYLDISDVFDAWYDALECYELFRGGVLDFPYKEFYRVNSVVRGIEAGCALAKAYALRKCRSDELPSIGTHPLIPKI